MDAIAKDLERASKRQRLSAKETLSAIKAMVAAVDVCKASIAAKDNGENTKACLAKLHDVVKTQSEAAIKSYGEQHQPIAKLGKSIEKAFQTNLSKVFKSEIFENKEEHLRRAIAEHLFRVGRFNIAESFMQEARITMDVMQLAAFRDLFAIVADLKQHSVQSALVWVANHRDQLGHIGQTLEFKLHSLELFKRLAAKDQLGLIEYVKTNMEPFTRSELHFKELKRIMTALLYIDRLPSSPFASMLNPSHWREAVELLTRASCSLTGLPHESPLFVSISAGCVALPVLQKVAHVVAQTNREDSLFNNTEELLVEIDLGKDRKYHSSFACPVSRENATEENPPMRLLCGHVICRESLNKMAKNSPRRKFKCAYCPREQTMAELQQIWF